MCDSETTHLSARLSGPAGHLRADTIVAKQLGIGKFAIEQGQLFAFGNRSLLKRLGILHGDPPAPEKWLIRTRPKTRTQEP